MGTSDQPVRHLDDNIDNTTKLVAPITEEYLDKLYQNALNALGHGEQSKFGIAIKKQIVNKLKKKLKELNNSYS